MQNYMHSIHYNSDMMIILNIHYTIYSNNIIYFIVLYISYMKM